MKSKKKDRCPPRGASRRRRSSAPYPVEVRRKAVKLCLEEGFDVKLVAREVGVNPGTVYGWLKAYRERGEAGLEPRRSTPGPRKRKVSSAVQAKITEVKRAHPSFGIRRISQWLRRVLFLQTSPETVRRTLHREGLMPKTRKKPKRNPPKPRFFERSTPNQLWQSDLFTFRLGGKNAYLIGFVDDYSRYVVGLGLFRSQTAEHVLEVYRTAVGEYGVPKEMLTDQGRQYANWRGKTRFQLELQKDRVHHLMSRPHHPMTLGKVERFWKTIWEEFLVRAQFGSFEEAQERVRHWVKHYNHRRPHQGLDGLCPADRFYEVQQELRKVMEQQIQENVLELAMKREPKEPFYMVGRMGGQSVVLSVEKGRFRMQVDGDEPVRAVNYATGEGHDRTDPGFAEGCTEARGEEGTRVAQREGEGAGCTGAVDGAEAAVGCLPGDGGQAVDGEPLAGAGDGGYAGGPGAAEGVAGGAEADAAEEGGAAVGAQERERAADEAVTAAGKATVGETTGARRAAGEREDVRRSDEAEKDPGGTGSLGPSEGGADRASAERPDNGDGSGAAAGGVAKDLLRVGAPGALGDDRGASEQGRWPAVSVGGLGEGDAEEALGGAAGSGSGARAG